MISAVPLPLLRSVGPLYQMRTSSASSCALRPNEWTSSVLPCLLQQTLQPGPAPAPTELSTKGTDRFFFFFSMSWRCEAALRSLRREALSLYVCPFGHNKALSMLYIICSMKINLKLTRTGSLNTSKLSVVSGTKMLFSLNCFSWLYTHFILCIFKYTSIAMFVFIVLLMMIYDSVHCHPTTKKSCIWTVDLQVQDSFHVFCLYVSYLVYNLLWSLTKKINISAFKQIVW